VTVRIIATIHRQSPKATRAALSADFAPAAGQVPDAHSGRLKALASSLTQLALDVSTSVEGSSNAKRPAWFRSMLQGKPLGRERLSSQTGDSATL
jgi:hypothetical protein